MRLGTSLELACCVIRQVKQDLREWTLSRVVWVADRGFSSINRRSLMQGSGGYIIGEKLRSDTPEIKQALARPVRYKTIRDNMQVKEVNIDSDDRFVICFNPEQVKRDAAIRAELVTRLEEAIADSDKLSATERGPPPAACCASTSRRSRPRPIWTTSTSCTPATRS
jgi:hypothetical protein